MDNIQLSFIPLLRILYIFKNLDILIGYQIFHIFNMIRISMFPNTCYLFISWVLADSNIKILKICLSIMLGASFVSETKNLQKITSFFF
jgi:hypothetical protein